MENNRDRKPEHVIRRTAQDRRHSTSRERVLREVEAHDSASINDLAEATGLHPNTVRAHLARLTSDGYLRAVTEAPVGRGRPATRWSAVDPDEVNPYAGLAEALADTVGSLGPDAPQLARQAGFAWGQRLAHQHGHSGGTRELLRQVATEQGFDPEDRGSAMLLRRCPLHAAASRRPEVVCAVHAGLVSGVSRVCDDGIAVRLEPLLSSCPCVLHIAEVA